MFKNKRKNLLNIADSNFNLGNYQEALIHYQEIWDKDHTDLEVLEKIGDTHYNLNNFQNSLSCYEYLISKSNVEKDLARVNNSIANIYYSLDHYSRAIYHYQKAIDIQPKEVLYYKNLQNAILKRKSLSKSIVKTNQELEKSLDRAKAFLKVGNYEQVRLNVKKVQRIDPDNEDAYKLLQVIEEKIGKNNQKKEFINVFEEEPEKKNNPKLELLLNKLDGFIGLENIKSDLKKLINQVRIDKLRVDKGLGKTIISYHSVFIGPPGTGKTTIARLLGDIYKELGILKKGHLIEADRSKLVAEYVGQTAVKTNQLIDSALDGILFIDEAYMLFNNQGGDYGKEAIDTLLKRMEDERNRLIVIVAGYNDEMNSFLESNPGLKSRFNRYFKYEHYKPDQLSSIFKKIVNENNYSINDQTVDLLYEYIKKTSNSEGKSFGNARFIRNIFEEIVKIQSGRICELDHINDQDLVELREEDIRSFLKDKVDEEESLEELLKKLDNLIGLNEVKEEVKALLNYIKIEKEREKHGLRTGSISLHSVFFGAPGTGKTTVARLLAKIYKQLGILHVGHLVEVDRADLVAEYLGQTSVKTSKKIEKAQGGVLFIDEAYTLSPKSSNDIYGQEAIETLLKKMEDLRGKFIVVVAGYQNEMQRFISSNPGLESRFNRYFRFENFTHDQLIQIFNKFLNDNQYSMSPKGNDLLNDHFKALSTDKLERFGNGRYVRNLFELIVQNLSNRLGSQTVVNKSELTTINASDIEKSIERINNQKLNEHGKK